jgi:hypothetical protein
MEYGLPAYVLSSVNAGYPKSAVNHRRKGAVVPCQLESSATAKSFSKLSILNQFRVNACSEAELKAK